MYQIVRDIKRVLKGVSFKEGYSPRVTRVGDKAWVTVGWGTFTNRGETEKAAAHLRQNGYVVDFEGEPGTAGKDIATVSKGA